VWAPVRSDCIICGKYVDHNLKRSLQGRKKQVKRGGELEIVYNVHKFVKTESEVSQSLFQKCRRQSLKQHVLAEELFVGY
jgi:uncharacterized protein Veg